MMTKLIATLTLSAALVMAAFAAKAELGHKKTGTVTVIELESYPADEADSIIDCEFVVTPKGTTKISGGEAC